MERLYRDPVHNIIALSLSQADDALLVQLIDPLARKEGVNIRKEVVEESDSVAKSIIDYAKKNDMDVIVIGPKGMTAVEGFFLGSVANNVIHHAHCPVFAIR